MINDREPSGRSHQQKLSSIIYHLSSIIYYLLFMNKKELWQKIIHFAITILTAIATTLGTTSCMGM